MADEIVYRLLQGDGVQIQENAAAKTVTISVPGLASKLNIGDIGPATKVSSGIVELATAAEVQSGADDVRAVTPAGLGAATQGSPDDATPGRLLKVGSFGLGGSVQLAGGVDLNSVVLSGFYKLNNAHPNMPAGFQFGQLIVSRGGDTIVQIVSDVTGAMAFRNGNPANISGSGVWTAWRSIYHSGNFDPATKANTSGNFPGITAGDSARVGGQLAIELAPPGMVAHFATTQAPGGWLRANGAAVSRATYAALFANIGTIYGAGNGSSTFNLPDLRGLFVRSLDDGRGVDNGRSLGTVQGSANLQHSHGGSTFGGGAHSHTGATDVAGDHAHSPIYLGGSSDDNGDPGNYAITSPRQPNGQFQILSSVTGNAGNHQHSFSTSGVGDHSHSLSISADGAGESRPINIALLACIKF